MGLEKVVGKMLDQSDVDYVLRKLAAGTAIRAIHRNSKISRRAIKDIRDGVHPLVRGAVVAPGSGPAGECPTCGHRVPLPCVACAAKRNLERAE